MKNSSKKSQLCKIEHNLTYTIPLKEIEKRVISLMIEDPSYKESKSGNWRIFRYLEANEGMEFFIKGQKVDAKWLKNNMFPIDNIRRVCQKLVELDSAVYGPTSERSNIAAKNREQETLAYVRRKKMEELVT